MNNDNDDKNPLAGHNWKSYLFGGSYHNDPLGNATSSPPSYYPTLPSSQSPGAAAVPGAPRAAAMDSSARAAAAAAAPPASGPLEKGPTEKTKKDTVRCWTWENIPTSYKLLQNTHRLVCIVALVGLSVTFVHLFMDLYTMRVVKVTGMEIQSALESTTAMTEMAKVTHAGDGSFKSLPYQLSKTAKATATAVPGTVTETETETDIQVNLTDEIPDLRLRGGGVEIPLLLARDAPVPTPATPTEGPDGPTPPPQKLPSLVTVTDKPPKPTAKPTAVPPAPSGSEAEQEGGEGGGEEEVNSPEMLNEPSVPDFDELEPLPLAGTSGDVEFSWPDSDNAKDPVQDPENTNLGPVAVPWPGIPNVDSKKPPRAVIRALRWTA